jgi:hypothetical protein
MPDEYMSYMASNPPRYIASLTHEPAAVLREAILSEYGDYTSTFGIHCPCGNRQLRVQGYAHPELLSLAGPIIVACDLCRTESVVFDPVKNGWSAEQRGFTPWPGTELRQVACETCRHHLFEVATGFQYDSDDDEELPSEEAFRRQDYFLCFLLEATCIKCGTLIEIAGIECA